MHKAQIPTIILINISHARIYLEKSSFNDFSNIFLDESKFYISFENSLCDDYATEKFFHVQTFTTAVPIVMGETKEWWVKCPFFRFSNLLYIVFSS